MVISPWNFKPSQSQLLYSITGVNRGIYNFSNFAIKHELWVLISTASIYVLEIYHNCLSEAVYFYSPKIRSLLHLHAF